MNKFNRKNQNHQIYYNYFHLFKVMIKYNKYINQMESILLINLGIYDLLKNL
jgi:hypothetical protein